MVFLFSLLSKGHFNHVFNRQRLKLLVANYAVTAVNELKIITFPFKDFRMQIFLICNPKIYVAEPD